MDSARGAVSVPLVQNFKFVAMRLSRFYLFGLPSCRSFLLSSHNLRKGLSFLWLDVLKWQDFHGA